MTDTTTDESPPEEPAAATEVDASAPAEPPALPPAPPAKTPFWQRRYTDQFLVPLILPVLVVLAVLVYVLNISRLFLSAHGNLPIIIGTIILLTVLIGASVLSAGSRLQTPTVILLTSVFLLAIAFSGWISLGHSEEEGGGASTLPADLKTTQEVKITAAPGGQLIYAPDAVNNLKTGLVKFVITWAGTPHTFGFHEDSTDFGELKADGVGKQSVGVAYFGKAGQYNFFCSVPSHEAAGMKGTVTVAGPDVTLEQAVTEAGNPPDAIAGGGK